MRPSPTYPDGTYQEWAGARPGKGRSLARVWLGVASRGRRIGGRWRTFLRTVVVLLPTIIAAVYYGGIAADRYVSEARFIIRTASKPANMLGGLSALLQLVGMSRSQDDAYAVHDFLTSRDALRDIASRFDLRKMYNDPSADFLARYPSLLFGSSDEDFYLYYQHMLTVVVNNTTGLTTLRVEAFRPQDAQRVARALLDQGEDLVNRLNTRMQEDAVKVAEADVARAEQRRVANQVAITAFRNRELILDPGKSSALVFDLIGKLASQLADVRAQIGETRGNSPNSPQLAAMNQRAAALERQIAFERGRIADTSDGLAAKIAEFEQMMLEQEFSIRTLSSAVQALEAARTEARRQQLFLERVVEPDLPDESTVPERWRMVLTVFGFNVVGMGVLWLIGSGLREHTAAQRSH
jgi:capsular polysaccharide transport system permease protein